jgi:hypothetical protein
MVICVKWQLRQTVHQLKSLGAQRSKLLEPRGVALPLRHREIGQCHRIEVVIRQCDEPKASPTELHDFVDDGIHTSLARLLAVRAPHRAERAMFGAAAHGLNRAPHVASMWQQFPPRRDKSIRIHTSGLIQRLQGAVSCGGEHDRPDDITIALDHGMGSSKLVRLIGVQRRVDATKDNRRASLPGEGTDLVAAKRIAGVNPDAHDVARLHARNIERL